MYKSAKELRGIGWKRIREHNNYWGVCLLSYLFLLVMELLYIGIIFLTLSLLYKQSNAYQYPYEYMPNYPYEYMPDSKTWWRYSMLCSLLSIAVLLLSVPFQLGLVKISLAAARGQKVSVKDLFFGFRGGRFWKSIGLSISNSILIALWSFLLILPGIVKTFEYALSFYVLADHPEMSITETRKESMRLMSENKMRLFLLELSWIGWIFLCVATFGILMLWVMPAVQICSAAFYCNVVEEDCELSGRPSPNGYERRPIADPFQYFSRYSSSAPVPSNAQAPSENAAADTKEPSAVETPTQNEALSSPAIQTPVPRSDPGDGENEENGEQN